MRSNLTRLVLTGLSAAMLAGSAVAADYSAPAADRFAAFNFFEEVRIGVHDHNPSSNESGTIDINGQILTSPINNVHTGNIFYDTFFNPRLHLGAMVNTSGKTSFAYTGVTWRANFTERLFGEVEFGAAVNNSPSDYRPDRVTMGCAVTFHETAGLGYRLTQNVSVILDVDHISHASMCGGHNPGITDFGVKVGYRF